MQRTRLLEQRPSWTHCVNLASRPFAVGEAGAGVRWHCPAARAPGRQWTGTSPFSVWAEGANASNPMHHTVAARMLGNDGPAMPADPTVTPMPIMN